MKLIRIHGEQFTFQVGTKEKDLLIQVLNLYPLVPATHHRLSKGRQIPNQEENQQLLDEALKAQREENRRGVQALLSNPGRFAESTKGFQLSLARGDMEWLLQVLNDIRVGSWIALGSPEQGQEYFLSDMTSRRQLKVMEEAGDFEIYFLNVITGDLLPEPE